MKQERFACVAVVLGALLTGGAVGQPQSAYGAEEGTKGADQIPTFRFDPDYPKTLPNHWITGNIGAMYMDKNDHLWIIQRPASTTGLGERDALDGQGECCTPAPPVIEFDYGGNVARAWGPIHVVDPQTKAQKVLENTGEAYPDGLWPPSEHALYIDSKDNVWISSNMPPSQVLKLTKSGKFLMRIGKQEATSSNDKENLGGPAGIYVDPKTNEIFIADGYWNRRVIVFDADTGAYKRHWGAYGKMPPDGPQQASTAQAIEPDQKKQHEQFSYVHCITASNDGLLYVCDRANSRIQVFKKDGTFVSEVYVQPTTKGIGTVYSIAFSPDPAQRFLYVGDGSNKKVHILRRSDLKILGSFGTGGRQGGEFLEIHAIATDSKGNVYVGETVDGNRLQRFILTGMKSASEK